MLPHLLHLPEFGVIDDKVITSVTINPQSSSCINTIMLLKLKLCMRKTVIIKILHCISLWCHTPFNQKYKCGSSDFRQISLNIVVINM